MSKDSSVKLRYIVLSAMFAALITVATMLHIPSLNGYIHFGDAIIYITASCLSGPYAFAASAIGGALSDIISGCAIWAPATFIIKGILSLSFTYKNSKMLCKRNYIACAIGLVITVAGYFCAEWIMYGFAASVAAVYGNLIQGVGSAVIFIIIAAALDKIGFKQKVIK